MGPEGQLRCTLFCCIGASEGTLRVFYFILFFFQQAKPHAAVATATHFCDLQNQGANQM